MSLNESADSAAIVNAIISLGESLNLPITAEGVEDAEIEARLRALGCAKAQGWYYSKPLSIANVRRLLAERRLLRGAASVEVPTPVTSQRRVG
jgi:EAL domain-containing protein (putative c-di-GMP-specific phosphodiesterase class I)